MPYLRSTTAEPYHKRSKTMYNRAKDSEFIPKWGRPRQFETPMKVPKKSDPNSILRVVVWNSAFEVTTDTLHYLFSQYSAVLRIVLFTQNGLPNGMIEMDSVEGASRARDYLNGFEMYYGGVNRLQIEFAWTTKLFVRVNDMRKSWDYTENMENFSQPMLCQQQTGYYDAAYQTQPVYSSYPYCYVDPTSGVTQSQMIPQQSQMQSSQQPMIIFSSTPVFQQNVMYVSGLTHEISNTDKLFNLLSLYGNVAKIQFLACRQGTAIVQMFDSLSVDTCIRFLNNIPVGFHGRIQVSWSNSNYVPSGSHMFKLADGSANFKNFIESKNQRFLVPRPSFWIQPPAKIVRYYNTPASLSEENIMDILENKPKRVRCLKMPADEESHLSRGLLEFSSVAEAILAVIKFNNKEIRTNSKTIHFMKLCFSSSQSVDLKN